jgi:ribonuclease HI
MAILLSAFNQPLLDAGVRDWIPCWQKRKWKTSDGKDVKNKAVIIYLSHLLDERGRRGQVVRLQHVRGHAGIPGNEAADRLAGAGTLMSAMPERDWTLPKEENSKNIKNIPNPLFRARPPFLLFCIL